MTPTTFHRLTTARIEQAYRLIDPVFLNSPQYECESLGRELNIRAILKVETQNPIRSFKGRGSDFLVSQAPAGQPIYCASAGNFGQAMAYACRKRDLPLTVFASTQANPLKLERMQSLGARVVLHGDDFDAAKSEARQQAERKGVRFVEDSLDIETLEGAGTIGLELLNYPIQPDFLLIALGNGALFSGNARIFKDRSPQTKVIAVQAAGAPAMIESWKKKALICYDTCQTIADGIAVREPIAQALTDMEGLADDGLLVREESIVAAMKLLHRHAGLVVEPSGAVGIAAVLEDPERFRGSTVATIVCGGNLTEAQMGQWLG
jgi:threonine dehydratase